MPPAQHHFPQKVLNRKRTHHFVGVELSGGKEQANQLHVLAHATQGKSGRAAGRAKSRQHHRDGGNFKSIFIHFVVL